MSQNLSPDEIRGANMAAMGPELGELYTALANELTLTCWRWQQSRELFAQSTQRIDLLNASAPFFFWVVQDVLFRETVLGITRLTAPPQTHGHNNLTVKRLPKLIEDDILRERVQHLCESVVAKAAFAREWRNKLIAHHDLKLALGQRAAALPSVTRAEIDEVLTDLADLLNVVDERFNKATTLYEWFDRGDGAGSLLYVLRDGIRLDEKRREMPYDPSWWHVDLPPL